MAVPVALQVVEVLVAQGATPVPPEGRGPATAAALHRQCPQRVVAVVHRHQQEPLELQCLAHRV